MFEVGKTYPSRDGERQYYVVGHAPNGQLVVWDGWSPVILLAGGTYPGQPANDMVQPPRKFEEEIELAVLEYDGIMQTILSRCPGRKYAGKVIARRRIQVTLAEGEGL